MDTNYMRCETCGYYYYEEPVEGGEAEIIKGDERFIRLQPSFKTEDGCNAELYACPKCFAVRVYI